MHKTLKIVLPLIVSVAAAASLLFVTYQLQTGKRMLRNGLSHSAKILGEACRRASSRCSIAYRADCDGARLP
jgi:hypothetical protein